MKLLDQSESTGILPLSQDVLKELVLKHPPAKEADPNVLMRGEVSFVDPARFNNIDEAAIARAVLRTKREFWAFPCRC